MDRLGLVAKQLVCPQALYVHTTRNVLVRLPGLSTTACLAREAVTCFDCSSASAGRSLCTLQGAVGGHCSPALLSGTLAERVSSVGGQVQINPQVRLPRTFKRFCGLLVQLLQKLSIRATNGPDKLLKVCRSVPFRTQPKLSTAHHP